VDVKLHTFEMEMGCQLQTLVTVPSVTIQQNMVAKRKNLASASNQIPAMQAIIILNKQTKYCTDKTGEEQNGFLKGLSCCERYFSKTHYQKTKRIQYRSPLAITDYKEDGKGG
jgi:hypothetical protein